MDTVKRFRTLALAPLLVLLGGCLTGPEDGPPDLEPADVRVLFLGNSLTFVHDVPGLVQALADADGRSMAHATIAEPNFSLQEHWSTGAPEAIRETEPDIVVLQQGPSSLPENRQHLVYWSQQFDAVIREAGGEPALFMVWPSLQRQFAFPDVWTSYREAADSVGGLFAPAGQTWVEAWELDQGLQLYSADGFHQSYLGALAAAMTLYAVLFDVPADSVPDLDDGVAPATRQLLRSALTESLLLGAGT